MRIFLLLLLGTVACFAEPTKLEDQVQQEMMYNAGYAGGYGIELEEMMDQEETLEGNFDGSLAEEEKLEGIICYTVFFNVGQGKIG